MKLRNIIFVIVLSLSVASLPAGKRPKPPEPPKPAMEVVDSNGTRVGDLIGFVDNATTPIVALQVDDWLIGLKIIPDGYLASGPIVIYWDSPGCTGTPYIQYKTRDYLLPMLSGQPRGTEFIVAAPGNTVYLPDPAGTPFVMTSNLYAYRITDGACFEDEANSGLTLIEALPLVDLDQYFTPPFTLNYLGTPLR